ncbi:methyl-accepting chemotaxis protein [Virgibacillus natechei]|uniref:Methyl-accepting chemotaxis protein n=2 Tax=Virgibacillus natechei TaxID=1216297 RepID=A0ABS4IEJ7_9BACI|nr:methyl-accepting chemotaxis protein [Virgibacillus natechei]
MARRNKEQVTEGLEMVEKRGKNFESILDAVEDVDQETQLLTALSKRMSQIMENVNTSVTEVSKTAN